MSKMSQLHADLNVQASELGFASLEDALAVGYQVDYETATLVRPINEELDMAHKEWLEEKDVLINDLFRAQAKAIHENRMDDADLFKRLSTFIQHSIM